MEGARHTARFPGVIWLSWAEAMSLRKYSRVCSTSRFSSGSRMTAACTACKRCSFGTPERQREPKICIRCCLAGGKHRKGDQGVSERRHVNRV